MKASAENPEWYAILLCGKRAPDGRQTCPGAFGDRVMDAMGRPIITIYGIMSVDERGVWRMRPHARKQMAAGRQRMHHGVAQDWTADQ